MCGAFLHTDSQAHRKSCLPHAQLSLPKIHTGKPHYLRTWPCLRQRPYKGNSASGRLSGWVLSQFDRCPYKRSLEHRLGGCGRRRRLQTEERPGGNQPVEASLSGFQPPDCKAICLYRVSPRTEGFVVASGPDQCTALVDFLHVPDTGDRQVDDDGASSLWSLMRCCGHSTQDSLHQH